MRHHKVKGRLLAVLILLMFLVAPMTKQVHAYNELEHIKSIIKDNYIYSIDSSVLKSNNAKEIFEKLDEHSVYYTRDEFRSFMQTLNSSIGGIGVYIQKNIEGDIIVSEVIKDSPAQDVGLNYGDTIIEINGKSTTDMPLDEAANLIRGNIGTKINLKIKKQGMKEVTDVEITRANVKVESVSYSILNNNIGYLKIKSFNEGVSKEVKKSMDYFNQNNIRLLILDVRGNGGGLLSEAVEISKMFIRKSPVVHVKTKGNMITYESSALKAPYTKENLVVLIDENSASASEILASAIQDSNSGVLVGKTSFGKGTVQKLYSLYSGAGFKLTESTYLSPNMREIEGKGIKPDYEIERFINNIETEDLELVNIKDLKVESMIVQDQILMPVRDLFEKLNYSVIWEQSSRSIIVKREQQAIKLPVESKIIYVNGKEVELEKPINIINNIAVIHEDVFKTVLWDNYLSAWEQEKIQREYINYLWSEANDGQIQYAIKTLSKVSRDLK